MIFFGFLGSSKNLSLADRFMIIASGELERRVKFRVIYQSVSNWTFSVVVQEVGI